MNYLGIPGEMSKTAQVQHMVQSLFNYSSIYDHCL